MRRERDDELQLYDGDPLQFTLHGKTVPKEYLLTKYPYLMEKLVLKLDYDVVRSIEKTEKGREFVRKYQIWMKLVRRDYGAFYPAIVYDNEKLAVVKDIYKIVLDEISERPGDEGTYWRRFYEHCTKNLDSLLPLAPSIRTGNGLDQTAMWLIHGLPLPRNFEEYNIHVPVVYSSRGSRVLCFSIIQASTEEKEGYIRLQTHPSEDTPYFWVHPKGWNIYWDVEMTSIGCIHESLSNLHGSHVFGTRGYFLTGDGLYVIYTQSRFTPEFFEIRFQLHTFHSYTGRNPQKLLGHHVQ